jgi:hypothetical protein
LAAFEHAGEHMTKILTGPAVATVIDQQSSYAQLPLYAPIATWSAITGMARSRTYIELALGNLRAKKVGHRTVIDVQHGLAYMASLPDAQVRVPSLLAKNAA